MADEGETPTSWWDARGLQNNPRNRAFLLSKSYPQAALSNLLDICIA